MKEILPGIFHWTRVHPKIQTEVSSFWLPEEWVLIDPLVPQEGFDAFPEAPKNILLTNRHHLRDGLRFQERFGCAIWCADSGMGEFTEGEDVTPFRVGDILPGNIQSLRVGVICPDETALLLQREGGALFAGDGVVRFGDGPLGFVPDDYIGENPEEIKSGLRRAYAELLEKHRFDHLLLAHGAPWVGGGRQALEAFVRA